MTTLICRNVRRREQLRQHPQLNGLDYLEVGADQRTLTVFFLGKAPVILDRTNVRIEGGSRIRGIRVEQVDVHHYEGPELDDYMVVTVDRPGDFSTYTLGVVERHAAERDELNADVGWKSHSAFDPRYDRIAFNFKVECPGDLDCKQEVVCPRDMPDEPEINYLARDYSSFRQLILDRLALVMPDWKERHVPDIGIALVEVLAYVGDHLSYYQDAVATEAYLETARRRISVRRHARLVDYTMHEGCNSRAWLCVKTDADLTFSPRDVYFVTGSNAELQVKENVLTDRDLSQIPSSAYEVFEPLGNEDIHLYSGRSEIYFYTWGDTECCLRKGATSATLAGRLSTDAPSEEPICDPKDDHPESDPDLDANPDTHAHIDEFDAIDDACPQLFLKSGDVLIFKEVAGPETGHPGDANPKHRHAVRLTEVTGGVDPLNGHPVVEVSWAPDDALPFPLCISSLGPPPDCKLLKNVSLACGNVILTDHGESLEEDLPEVQIRRIVECCKAEGTLADSDIVPEVFRPTLNSAPLTFSQPFARHASATKSISQDTGQTLPRICLDAGAADIGLPWEPRRDLLSSGPDDRHFVVELDNDGCAHLRFGDDESGEQPDAGTAFHARYRIGNGPAGNVGAGAISHLVLRNRELSGVNLSVHNPLPAQGGTAPEPIEEVKLFAPHTFRTRLERAITADDYAAIAQREFPNELHNAVASLRWTGSAYEALVVLDPYGADDASSDLLEAVTKRLYRYRRMGHDVVVQGVRRVALDIELIVCVRPNYLRGHLKAVLFEVLGDGVMPDGRLGFFHADKLTFGEGIYVSELVAMVQAVEGVENVLVGRLQRYGEPPNQEIENGILPLSRLEVARLDNDPSFPEHGRLTLDMRGGR